MRHDSLMTNVIPLRPFTVNVIFDAECHMFVATCADLALCTEAPSFEALTDRVWEIEIAPDMARENGLHIARQTCAFALRLISP